MKMNQSNSMAKAIMFLGTGSDVGKSIVAAAMCRILRRRGYRVAPFKAQNMSNNSYVTLEGGEIGRAQVVQAEAAGLVPSVHMNPVLLKPSGGQGAQVVVQGKVLCHMDAMEYHNRKSMLVKAVKESYDILSREYDVIVMEGAGSCCEMNLKKNDIVNYRMAILANASCVIVGDIDRGGIFAQLIGTHCLLSGKEREITSGFIINKFRGDKRLFDSGVTYIEEKTSLPVFGVVPFYNDIRIDPEDSVSVQKDRRALKPTGKDTVNIAVIKLPAISNFTDLEIFESEPDVVVNFLFHPDEMSMSYDCLIIPGTKNAMEDALWMQQTEWSGKVREFYLKGGRVIGICGGYQLLGRVIHDRLGVESARKEVEGIGLLPVATELAGDKVVRKVTGVCLVNKEDVEGYEIHMGRTQPVCDKGMPFLRLYTSRRDNGWNDGWIMEDLRVAGTYLHGLFDSPGFREAFLNRIREEKGLQMRHSEGERAARFREYDRLADHFEAHCDIDRMIYGLHL